MLLGLLCVLSVLSCGLTWGCRRDGQSCFCLPFPVFLAWIASPLVAWRVLPTLAGAERTWGTAATVVSVISPLLCLLAMLVENRLRPDAP